VQVFGDDDLDVVVEWSLYAAVCVWIKVQMLLEILIWDLREPPVPARSGFSGSAGSVAPRR